MRLLGVRYYVNVFFRLHAHGHGLSKCLRSGTAQAVRFFARLKYRTARADPLPIKNGSPNFFFQRSRVGHRSLEVRFTESIKDRFFQRDNGGIAWLTG